MNSARAQTSSKRGRPPNLSLAAEKGPLVTNTVIEPESPVVQQDDCDDDAVSASPASSAYSSPVGYPLTTETDSDASDEFTKDMVVLERLRRNVQNNLRLRPLRMASSPNLQQSGSPSRAATSPPSTTLYDFRQAYRATSPASSIGSPSIYYTPFSDLPTSPRSAHFLGFMRDTPPLPLQSQPLIPPRSPSPRPTRGISASTLCSRLASPTRPLLIDTRQPGSYLASRLQHSVNIAIPTLILKRCRKPGGGFTSMDALRQFVTTDRGKDTWDELMRPGGAWDGDVVLYDEEMLEKDRDSILATAWALLPVLAPLVNNGRVDYLKGGLSAARLLPEAHYRIISGERELDDPRDREDPGPLGTPKKGGGLFQLDPAAANGSRTMPEIDRPTPPSSPEPRMPVAVAVLNDTTPSPSPSASVFPRTGQSRRPSVPNLRRIDTSSTERLPKLQLRAPLRSQTLAAPVLHHTQSSSSLRPNSPSHLNLVHSNHTPPGSAFHITNGPGNGSQWPPRSSSRRPPSPRTPMPASPTTARPEDQAPTTEEPPAVFTISTILPNFLFLGPELTLPEQVQELQALGVKRILNIAAECDDDLGLGLREVFERYIRIPMRDTVEEENVARGVRQVCDILDDARLHSSATYVHCKAGKSRSVTAVMAYLIHANHWTLSRAYAFVLERRKGISPNIGFVSELMNFEEEELGGKSIGVVNGSHGEDADGDGGGKTGNYMHAAGNRRAAHMRESLPPVFNTHVSELIVPGAMAGTGLSSSVSARVGDSQQEMEIKDAQGRYRHARRAPVDETTLQPLRRVSKAGLETSSYA